jgi:hypothetical protein
MNYFKVNDCEITISYADIYESIYKIIVRHKPTGLSIGPCICSRSEYQQARKKCLKELQEKVKEKRDK